jgi:glycosyltransferase involved in cell wall biosynthesis
MRSRENQMRIALLSQWYAPEPEARVTQLAHELAQRGHDVTVLTGFPNYPGGRVYPGYKLNLWKRETVQGVNIVRMLLYPNHSRSAIKRALNYFSFAVSASLLGPLLCGPIDLLWVYHPPLTVGIPAWWIHFIRKVPFIYEIQDIWPETVTASGMMKPGIGTKMLEHLAQFVYRHAEAITVISPGFKHNLLEKGVPEEKLCVIPNWADENIFHPVPRDLNLGVRYNFVDHFNVLFSGNMGPAQCLETVIEAAALLADTPKIKFTLIGDGISLHELKTQVRNRNLSNVQFIERQPMDAMMQFHAWADGLLVQLRDDALFNITVPSKTMAYLASGRPILCAVAGDGADIVRHAKAGLVCPPNNPQALVDMILTLYEMSADEREEIGENGRKYYMEHFCRGALVDKFEALFNEVLERR